MLNIQRSVFIIHYRLDSLVASYGSNSKWNSEDDLHDVTITAGVIATPQEMVIIMNIKSTTVEPSNNEHIGISHVVISVHCIKWGGPLRGHSLEV